MATDPRQVQRVQHLVQIPPLPPVPELSSQMREQNGLFAPFKKFDQQHQEWARQVGQTLQTAHQSVVRAAKASQTAQVYADRGWAHLVRSNGFWWYTTSLSVRPNSARISIRVTDWRKVGYISEVNLTTFNDRLQIVGTSPSGATQIWVDTGTAPREFAIEVISEGTEDFSKHGMIGGQPLVTVWPGSAMGSVPEVTDACHTVLKPMPSVAGVPGRVYRAWLKSDEDANPASPDDLHADGCFVSLV